MTALSKTPGKPTHHHFLSPIEEVIEDARNGRMFILVDAEERENEGDLVIPAQMATPDVINFMAKHGRGLICLALTPERAKQLLKEAGYPNGFDAGEVTTTVQYSSPTEAAVNYLGAVGIRARIRTMERAAWLTAWKEKKIRGLGFCGAGGFGNAVTRIENYFISTGTYAYVDHPDIDQLFRKQDVETDVMKREQTLIPVDMDQEEVALRFQKYALISAAVVDPAGRLVGMITVDDIVHIIQEEAGEDVLLLSGAGDGDINEPIAMTVRTRLTWLVFNLGTAILASSVVGLFQGEITRFALLAVLMPIVSGMGGNAGTQTLAVAVRALATNQLLQIAPLTADLSLPHAGISSVAVLLVAGLAAYGFHVSRAGEGLLRRLVPQA